ncbi:MAG: helix-hairpin-helix domain-containing protein [Desulfobacteraceae bacterium]|jgi:competence protein ComEA
MNPRINHGRIGYLLLLLTLLVIHFLKPALMPSMPSGSADEGQLFIQIGGDVKSPAVYAFQSPPNLAQLINRAGGLSDDRVLPDQFEDLAISSGMKVTVYLGEEKPLVHHSEALRGAASGGARLAKVSEMSAFYKTTLGIPICLNSESEMGLTAIPGIGLGLAKTIVEERTKRGGFKSLGELLSINGIGEKLYRKITPYLTLKKRYGKEIHPVGT